MFDCNDFVVIFFWNFSSSFSCASVYITLKITIVISIQWMFTVSTDIWIIERKVIIYFVVFLLYERSIYFKGTKYFEARSWGNMMTFSLPELLLSLKFQTFAKHLTRSNTYSEFSKTRFLCNHQLWFYLVGLVQTRWWVTGTSSLYPFIVECWGYALVSPDDNGLCQVHVYELL